jgi:hypothetical protein
MIWGADDGLFPRPKPREALFQPFLNGQAVQSQPPHRFDQRHTDIGFMLNMRV